MKEALTRKFGPLPAWAWALILAVGVYYYRTRMAGTSSASATGTASDLTPPAPGDPVVLQPGESVYDPSTGQLLGGGGDPGSGAGVGGGGFGDGLGAGAGFDPGGNGNVSVPSASPGGRTRRPRKHPRHPAKRRRPKLAPKGSKWFGRRRPGRRWRGIGGGWWAPLRPRHPAAIKDKGRKQKAGSRQFRFSNSRRTPSGGAAPVNAPVRTRKGPVRSMVTRTDRQHPVSHNPPTPRTHAHVPPRPSHQPQRNANRTRHVGPTPRHRRRRHR